MFEDIRKGAPQPSRRRMNDPGLQVNHIIRFMQASIWKTMDDGESVSRKPTVWDAKMWLSHLV